VLYKFEHNFLLF